MPDIRTTTTQTKTEFERQFAGAVFLAPEFARTQLAWLTPDKIGDLRIREWWQRVLHGDEPSAAALDVKILADLMGWSDVVPTGHSASIFARKIAEFDYLLAQMTAMQEAAVAIGKGDVHAVATILARAAERMPATTVDAQDAYDTALAFVDLLKRGQLSFPTYIEPIDYRLGGSERGNLVLVAARPSMGKSAFVNQVARGTAANKHIVAHFPLESGAISLAKRWACGSVGVAWRDIMAGRASAEDIGRVENEALRLGELYGKSLLIFDGHHTTDSVWEVVARTHADLVVIDHLEYLEDGGIESKVERLGVVAQRLKRMARDLNCCVWLVHQLNRKVEARENKVPMLADLRESGYLEQIADVVIMIYRPDYYENDAGAPEKRHSDAKFLIAKNRDGVAFKSISLRYDVVAQWFSDPKSPPDTNGHTAYVTDDGRSVRDTAP